MTGDPTIDTALAQFASEIGTGGAIVGAFLFGLRQGKQNYIAGMERAKHDLDPFVQFLRDHVSPVKPD
jgi:hypothetical protein